MTVVLSSHSHFTFSTPTEDARESEDGDLRIERAALLVLRADWLGSSLSSEPRRLAGLSVPRHAGVLARSKISGSLLHRLSRPWHGLGPRGSHRDRYGAPPKFSSPAAGAY